MKKNYHKRFGTIAVDKGYIKEDQLVKALEMQANENVMDGTQWELKLSYNGFKKRKIIYGSNAYPDSEINAMEFTDKFIMLLKTFDIYIAKPFFDS